MKFEFGLEKLLDHKRTLEQLAQREWAEAQAVVDDAKKELNGLYDQVDDARKSVSVLERQGAKAPVLAQIDEFVNGQKIRIERQRSRIRELMAVAETKQLALVEAAKERKTLEKLKERRLEEFKLKRKKRELKETDELVTTRFKPTQQND